jgi:arylformamidase
MQALPSVRKIIDLSQPIYHNCPGWPTYEMVNVRYEAIYPNDGFTAERLNMNVHTATHLDVPFHFYPEGKTIEQFPIEQFQGEAVPIDLFGIAADTAIGVEHLEPYKDKVRPGDIVLLCTGWGQKRGYTKEYYNQWPYLSGEGAQWMADHQIKGVGIDGLSIGGWGEEKGVPPHKILLSNEIWPLEELNLTEELLTEPRWYLTAFPIKLQGFGGAPVRAVAMVFN